MAICLGSFGFGCATHGVERRHLGGQRYYLRCEGSLSGCLLHSADACENRSYTVITARDRRYYTGSQPAEVEHRSSEAVIECQPRGVPLFEEKDLLEALQEQEQPAAKPEESSEAPPKRVLCTPGASQACVGDGGCRGGQACLEDGSGFGPCRCAPAPSTSPEATPAEPPETGSGPSEETSGSANSASSDTAP